MKAVIFDFDGVLIHSKDSTGNYLWQKNVYAELGLTDEQMTKIYSGNWFLVMKGNVCIKQHLKQVFAELDISLSVDKFIDYWHKNDLMVNKEIIPVIKSIQGPQIYIGTNQDKLRADLIWNRFNQYFDGIFSSHEIGAIKPEIEFFRYIEAVLEATAEEIVFIDDSKSHVVAAATCGWKCHHYHDIVGLTQFLSR